MCIVITYANLMRACKKILINVFIMWACKKILINLFITLTVNNNWLFIMENFLQVLLHSLWHTVKWTHRAHSQIVQIWYDKSSLISFI